MNEFFTSFVEYKEAQIEAVEPEKKLVGRRILCSLIPLGVLGLMFLAAYVISIFA